MVNSKEIKGLIAKSAPSAVEFKRVRGGFPADFWLAYSALANTDGGTIILDVREQRRQV